MESHNEYIRIKIQTIGKSLYECRHSNTKDFFPTLNLDPSFVPVGTSKTFCVNIAWAPFKVWHVIDLYKAVNNLPECSGAYNYKSKWQASDPKSGVDVQIWKQKIE